MARGKDSSSDAFARWGTLAPCPSADAGAAANPGAWAGPRSETPPTLTDVRRGGDNGSGDAPAFPPPPLLLLQQGKGQAASRATSVDRGTVAPGAGAKLVSFAEQPGAGGGPVRSVRSVSSAPVQRTSGQPPAFPMANSSTASTRSSGHGVPSSARATPDLNSYMPFSGESGGGVKRGAVAEISSSSYSGDGALHADALLARLAGKAKQAAAAALSASRAGTTAPLLPEPFGVDDSLERQTSLAEGTRRRPKVATSPRTSDDAGGFDCASAAVAPSVAAGAGAGSADGARLAQLCKEDKAKVARLMQDLAKLRAEKDGHKVRFERLRAQNEEIVKEVASLRVKFGQSMQLLRKYQNIVQEGEIAGGRAAVVGDAGNGNGFCAVTDSGMADEIRSLREALQAAERRSQKAETEAVMERASRSAMSEELRKVRADAAVEALKQELAMVGVRQLALAAGATPGVLGGARKNAEHWGGSSFGAISQKKFQRSEKASTRGKGDYDEKDSRRGPVVLQVREGVKGGVSCYSGGSGSENSEDSSSRASRNGGSVDENARGGWERSDHGEVDRRGSKGLAAGFRSPSGSVSGLRGTTHLEEEEDEEEERRERSLSRGISTATARRPRTWFETASDDLRDGSSGSDSDRVLKNLGRRGSKGVDIKEEQQEPRHCGAHRSASARRRKTGVVRDELDDEACGGTAPGHYRSGRGGGGDAGAAAPPKLRVSWSSVSVRSEETTELGDDDETNLGDATDPGRRRRRGAASSVAPAQAPRGRHRGGVVAPRTDAFPFPKPPTTAVSPPLSSEISRRREGGAPQASSGLIRGHLDNRDHRDSSAAGKERYRGGSCRWVSRDVDRPGDTSSTYSTASVASRRAVFNTRRLPREVDVKRGGAPAAKAGAAAGPSSDRVGGCREGGRHDDRKPSHHADRHSRNLRGPDGGGSSRGFFDKSLLDLIDDIEGEEGGVDGARFDPDDDAKIRTASRRAVDPRRRDRQHRGVSGAGMGYL